MSVSITTGAFLAGSEVKIDVKTQNGMMRPGTFRVVAGPCTVESYEQFAAAAKAVKEAGFEYVRGGAFKPRTSPYSFQGLGEEGLKIMSEVAGDLGLKVVTEVMDPYDIELVMEHAQIIQIGARNMANFSLLKRVGAAIAGTDHGVVLKRGLAASIEEWLLAAEYVTSSGGNNVVLCERGIRTFETSTRFTLDLSAVLVAKRLTDLPVIVDPSHAAGRRDLVIPLSKAAVAAEADGLLVESHHEPQEALCDGEQALSVKVLLSLKGVLSPFANAMGREVI
jgi:3-deoxy-7-phosphoheptulonate synthase